MANKLLTDLGDLSVALSSYIPGANDDGKLGKIDINTLKAIIGVSANLELSTATTSTNPGTAVGNRMWITTESGTYTNFAGIVIAADEIAFLVDTGTTYVKATIPLTLSDYLATSAVVDNLTSTDSTEVLAAPQGSALGSMITNTPIIDVVNGGGTTIQATMAHARVMWFVGKTDKSFNVVTIPIVRDYANSATFTNSIIAKVWKNGTLIYTRAITVSELTPYNSLTSSDAASDFDFEILLPQYVDIVEDDIICVGWEPLESTEKVGYIIVTTATDTTHEYGGNYVMGSNTYGYVINETLTPDTLPSSQTYRYRVFLKKYDLNLPGLQSDIDAATFLYGDKTKLKGYVVESDVTAVESTGELANIKAYALGVRGVEEKTFNAVSFPIRRNYRSGLNFTGDLRAKIWLNQTLIKDVTISFTDVVSAYNSLLQSDNAYKFDYTIPLDKTYMLEPDDLVTFGVTCVETADYFNPFYKTVAATTDTEISENLRATSTDPNYIINATTPPTLSSLSYRFRVNLLNLEGIQSTFTPEYVFPKRVYSVVNNILYNKTSDGNSYNGFTRNHPASIYADHAIRTLPREMDIKFKTSNNEIYDFLGVIDYASTMYFNNTSNATTTATSTSVTLTGNDIDDVSATINHVSTLASVGKTTKPRVLCIGDSITYGQGAYWADNAVGGSAEIWNYPLMLQRLFYMDYVDNGSIAGQYEALILGHNKRTGTGKYNNSAFSIGAGHEGIQGATTYYYLSNTTTPFWDADTSSFKIQAWLDKYRTMDDTGTRLAISDSEVGSLVSDVTAYDVCVPTHIFLFFGANDIAGDASSNAYWADINNMISAIQSEYTTNGWGTVRIAVGLPDTAFTFFPSKYVAKFGDRVSFWAETLPESDMRHDKLFGFSQLWADVSEATQESTGVWYLPTFWAAPTAESVQTRRISRSPFGGDPVLSYPPLNPTPPDKYQAFGKSPRTHVNPNAHFAFAYQIYAWLKYTLTL